MPLVVTPPAEALMWEFLKDTNDASALQRFVEQFPTSAKRADAEQRMSLLATEAEKAASAADRSPRAARVPATGARRVGCFDSPIDGDFDLSTRAALDDFASGRPSAVGRGLTLDTVRPCAGSTTCLPAGVPGRRARRSDRCIRPVASGTSARQGRQLRRRTRRDRSRGTSSCCYQGRRLGRASSSTAAGSASRP